MERRDNEGVGEGCCAPLGMCRGPSLVPKELFRSWEDNMEGNQLYKAAGKGHL